MIPRTAFLLLFDLALTLLIARDTDCIFKRLIAKNNVLHFANPHWPGHYRADTRCKWIFNCHDDYVCRLLCDHIGLPRSRDCSVDKLIVSDVIGSNKFGHSFCGQDIIDVISNGTKISLELITSSNSPGGRFKCSVETATWLQAMYFRF